VGPETRISRSSASLTCIVGWSGPPCPGRGPRGRDRGDAALGGAVALHDHHADVLHACCNEGGRNAAAETSRFSRLRAGCGPARRSVAERGREAGGRSGASDQRALAGARSHLAFDGGQNRSMICGTTTSVVVRWSRMASKMTRGCGSARTLRARRRSWHRRQGHLLEQMRERQK